MPTPNYTLEGHAIRPPAEANSVILQAAIGCPHNKCRFCGTYRKVNYRIQSASEFEKHVKSALQVYPKHAKRFFFADGDAAALPTETLLENIKLVMKYFPDATRFACYARAEGIQKKSESELKQLRKMQLQLFYLGLESGDDNILKKINKGTTAKEMEAAVLKAKAAEIKLSVMALIGIAGQTNSLEHARNTAAVLSRMNPRFINILTYRPVPGTELQQAIAEGKFQKLTNTQSLQETREILKELKEVRSVFRADHASNPLPLSGTLPRDRDKLINQIDAALRT